MGNLLKKPRPSAAGAASPPETPKLPPKSLAEMGFAYHPHPHTGKRQLHHLKTGTMLSGRNWRVFTGGGDYGPLAKACMRYIHEKIMIADKQLNIEWREVPHPASGNGDDVHLPRAAVLATADLLTNENGLLVLITGKGGPRAGIWGRQLCIADSLEHGSAWTMMHAAVSRGWAVLAFDPNRNTDDDGRKIPGSKTPEEHCVTAWRAFVTGVSNGPAGPSPARQIGVIAHSAGGGWLISCLQPQHTPDDQLHRIRGLAFTDSIHTMARRKLDDARFEILSKRACQWRAGPGKLDDPMVDDRAPAGQLELGCGCECRRAGTEDHASTNFMAEKSIFKFLDFHMDHEFVPPTPMDAPSCSFEFDDPDDSDSSDDDRRRGR